MDIEGLPLIQTTLDERVRRIRNLFYLQSTNGHLFVAGNALVLRSTIDLFDTVLSVYRSGSDRHGLAAQTLKIFHVVPEQQISLWVFDVQGLNCRVRITPDWMVRMRPVLEIAHTEAEDRLAEERIYASNYERPGWRRIRTATECGSD